MSRWIQDDCVGCPQGCGHCGRDQEYYVFKCDICGKQSENVDEFLHMEDNIDYCDECYKEIEKQT